MTRCFDFEVCHEDGYIIYKDGRRITASDLVSMLNQNGQADSQMPPWVQHFFVHVVKRFCKMLVAWIDDLQTAKIINRKDSHIRLK